jgi:hypothetical protein
MNFCYLEINIVSNLWRFIMQKVINTLALLSFAVSAGVVAGGYTLYANRENITDSLKSVIVKSVTESLQIPSTPELPTTGGDGPVTLPNF